MAWWPGVGCTGESCVGQGRLGWAIGLAPLYWLQLGSLAPGVILGPAWCDQRGHQSKTFILEAAQPLWPC